MTESLRKLEDLCNQHEPISALVRLFTCYLQRTDYGSACRILETILSLPKRKQLRDHLIQQELSFEEFYDLHKGLLDDACNEAQLEAEVRPRGYRSPEVERGRPLRLVS